MYLNTFIYINIYIVYLCVCVCVCVFKGGLTNHTAHVKAALVNPYTLGFW